jgi:hypothetical protein
MVFLAIPSWVDSMALKDLKNIFYLSAIFYNL